MRGTSCPRPSVVCLSVMILYRADRKQIVPLLLYHVWLHTFAVLLPERRDIQLRDDTKQANNLKVKRNLFFFVCN